MANITHDVVEALRPGEIIWDTEVKGFGIRCQRDRKVFILKARHRGRPVWLTIGDTGTWKPKQARNQASLWKRELRAGVDPEKLRASASGEPTVNDLCGRYLREHVEPRNKASTAATFKGIVERHIRPTLGKRTVGDVTSADVSRLHHRLRETPRTANQMLAVLSKMMSLAERWRLRPLNSNPCRHIERYREAVRNRFYDDAELQAIGAGITHLESAGAIQPGAATAIRLLALSGCRLGEVTSLEWADVDLTAGALNIVDAKAGARRHPIGAVAVAFLGALARVGPWVCVGGAPDRGVSRRRVQEAWELVRRKAGLGDGRLHDLRHGYATAASSAGGGAFMVRDLLGQKTLSMTSRYVNQDTDPLRRLADTVAARIGAALAGQSAAVVPLKKGGAA